MDIVRPDIDVKRLSRPGGVFDETDCALDKSASHFRAVFPDNFSVAEKVAAKGVFAGRFPVMIVTKRKDTVTQAFELGQGLIKAVFSDERSVTHITLAAH